MATPTLTQIAQALADLLPKLKPVSGVAAGIIAWFPGTAVPDGWLLCNGANVSRTTYANLFAAIGTKYGSGNGSSTFTLPNLSGRFIEGTTSTGSVGNTYSAGLPNITGTWYARGTQYGADSEISSATGAFGTYSAPKSAYNGHSSTNYNYCGVSFYASRASSIYGSSSVQPPSIALLPAIKT